MSVELNKLNRAGFGGGTTGVKKKSSGIASQATKNLANSSAASKSSIFSVKSSNKFHFTAGVNNVKNMHKANYQGVRASLNSRTYTPSNTGYVSSASSNVQYNVQNGMSKAMMTGQVIGQIAGGVFGLLNQTGILGGGDKVQTQSNTKQLDQILSGGNNHSISLNSSSASSAISSMQGATDSITLRSSIANANGALATMNNEAAKGNYEQKYATANKEMTSLKTGVSNAKTGVKTAENNLSTANNSVSISKETRDTQLAALKNADATYGKAVEAHTKAKDNVSQKEQSLFNAKNTLKNTDRYITKQNPDGTTTQVENPAYKAAQEAVDKADQELEAAKTAEKDAETARNEAKKNVDSSNKAVQTAEGNLDKAQNQLDSAKKTQTKAQNELQDNEKSLEKAETKLEQAEADVEKFKAYQQDSKKLKDEIDKQQKRLEKMEQEEQDDYNKLTDKINKGVDKNMNRAKNIDPSDGMNLKEKWLSYKMKNRNEKMNGQLDKKEALSPLNADSQYIKQLQKGPATFVSGNENYYKGTTPSGQEVYFRGKSPITKEMFEQAQGVSA